MANRIDSDEKAHDEPSHLGLHCLQLSVLVCSDERVKRMDTLSREITQFCKYMSHFTKGVLWKATALREILA